jgi:hypothetical protein
MQLLLSDLGLPAAFAILPWSDLRRKPSDGRGFENLDAGCEERF